MGCSGCEFGVSGLRMNGHEHPVEVEVYNSATHPKPVATGNLT